MLTAHMGTIAQIIMMEGLLRLRSFISMMSVLAVAPPSFAQMTADRRPPLPPLAQLNPHYATLVEEVVVDVAVDQLWQRIGGFCEIGAWVKRPCRLLSGTDRQLGAVRLVNDRVIEILVGKSSYSYTYAMPVRLGEPYNLAHGTLEAVADGQKRSRVIYTQVYDDSGLTDDAARAAEVTNRKMRLHAALLAMKVLVEAPVAK